MISTLDKSGATGGQPRQGHGLAPLALEIGHDLGLRRLAHVDDRLAVEKRPQESALELVIIKLLDGEAGRLHQASGASIKTTLSRSRGELSPS